MQKNNILEIVIGNTIKKAEENLKDKKTEDYTDEEGFLVCGNCKTRRQFLLNMPGLGINKKVASLCKCRQQEAKQEELERKIKEQKRQIDELRKTGITDNTYLKWTFQSDDNSNVKVGEATRKYTKEWQKMKRENIGLLLYGSVGTGKTFYAACIANALIDVGVSVLMTNLPMLMTSLSKNFEENKIHTLNKISYTSLLVIDDLGIERDTSFAYEKLQEIIDTRYRSGKPLIITTNMTPKELQNPSDIRYKRVYDRVLEMCYPIFVDGKSRRETKAIEKRNKAKFILGI